MVDVISPRRHRSGLSRPAALTAGLRPVSHCPTSTRFRRQQTREQTNRRTDKQKETSPSRKAIAFAAGALWTDAWQKSCWQSGSGGGFKIYLHITYCSFSMSDYSSGGCDWYTGRWWMGCYIWYSPLVFFQCRGLVQTVMWSSSIADALSRPWGMA